ncbi:MAG: leucine-rich repeat protein [Luteolibacter sp.]|uniref:leucine-rich repeat protein n=1 Tax=Luteolibacter sp. TaxID=1962973 RepID=UPI0032649B6C
MRNLRNVVVEMNANPPAIPSFFLALCLVSSAAADQFGDFTYTDDGTSITITDYPEAATGAVVIPEMISGKPVTGIADVAFLNCGEITSVSIPASVNSIADQAFVNCVKMTTVNIPNGVPRLGYNTFAACFVLNGVTIPSSVTEIGDSAFSACKGLTSITIPPTVTTMGHSVFYVCNSLASVTLSPNVTDIGQFQFYACSALTSVTIPAAVTSIGNSAFALSGLTEANFKGNAPLMGTNVFASTAAGFKVNYYNGKTGFTSPTWSGYDAVNVGDEPIPEIEVRQPENTVLADGVTGKDFGSVAIGGTVSLDFIIKNTGTGDLTDLTISVSGANPGDYQLGSLGATSLPAGETTSVTISFHPTAAGTRTAIIQIGSNDSDENPYDIGVTGVGLRVPEIVVQQPKGSGLADGKAKMSFGTAAVGEKGTSKKFIIKNTGKGKLTGLAITKNGSNAGDFIVTQPAKASISTDGSTTFTVTFKPTAKGNRNAAIHIGSNDASENPFDIKLAGMGAAR